MHQSIYLSAIARHRFSLTWRMIESRYSLEVSCRAMSSVTRESFRVKTVAALAIHCQDQGCQSAGMLGSGIQRIESDLAQIKRNRNIHIVFKAALAMLKMGAPCEIESGSKDLI